MQRGLLLDPLRRAKNWNNRPQPSCTPAQSPASLSRSPDSAASSMPKSLTQWKHISKQTSCSVLHCDISQTWVTHYMLEFLPQPHISRSCSSNIIISSNKNDSFHWLRLIKHSVCSEDSCHTSVVVIVTIIYAVPTWCRCFTCGMFSNSQNNFTR